MKSKSGMPPDYGKEYYKIQPVGPVISKPQTAFTPGERLLERDLLKYKEWKERQR